MMRHTGSGLEWRIRSPHHLPFSRLKGCGRLIERSFFSDQVVGDSNGGFGHLSSLMQALPLQKILPIRPSVSRT